jgi:protein-S-isoprenylcysteine O-methyltransferase Ste14
MTLLSHNTIAAIAGVTWAIVVIVWVIGRFTAKRTAVAQPWTSAVPYRILLLMAPLFLLDAMPLPNARLIHDAPELLGLTLIIGGAITTLSARVALARNWSGSVELQEGHELVMRGPYRFVRHPIYTGFLLMILGVALGRGTAQPFAIVLILVVVHVWKLRAEEALLAQHFPQAYPDYKARTKALIPFVI